MTRIVGTLRVGEAKATVGAVTARLQGSNASYYAIMFAFVGCGLAMGLLASFFLANGASPNYQAGAPLGIGVGAGAFLLIARQLFRARFSRRFQDREHSLELQFRIEVASEHLIYEVGGITQFARWPVVDEVFLAHDYWIFLSQAHSMYAPRRLFLDESEEKRFLSESLSHMSEKARARSTEAVRFVEFISP